MVWQDLDPVAFIWDFQDRIYHVDCKDAEARSATAQRPARLAPALGRPPPRLGLRVHRARRRAWEDCFRMLDAIGYDGPFSVEWEDAGMDRLVGAAEAVDFVRRLAFDRPDAASTSARAR